MSIKLMSLAWDLPDLAPTEKLVLLAYADYANDHGHAYPAVDSVARKCSLSARSVRTITRRLEARGLLRRDLQRGVTSPNYAHRGGRTNLYVLTLPGRPDPEAASGSGRQTRKLATPDPEVYDRKPGSLLPPILQEPSKNLCARDAGRARAEQIAPSPTAAAEKQEPVGGPLQADSSRPFGEAPLTEDERRHRASICKNLGLPIYGDAAEGGER